MRTFMVAMVSGLAALVGLAGAANANETVVLEWQDGGLNTILSPASGPLLMDVIIDTDDTNGTLGGDITIDYTAGGTTNILTSASCVNNALFPGDFTAFNDNGVTATGIGAIAFSPACIGSPCVLAVCTFQNTASVTTNLQLTTLYSLGEGVDNLPPANFPNGFGTAKIINTPEPGALAMLGLGFGGLILGRNRKS